jgi:hypothetical protein
MSETTLPPQGPLSPRTLSPAATGRTRTTAVDRPDIPTLRIVPWVDSIADPHGLEPCSRYVELFWLPIVGPSTTWLLRRLSYGLEMHPGGFDLDLVETARSLGLGERLGKNSPFRRALQRLCTFELARHYGPDGMAVRTRIPPLPLRHLSRLPGPLQDSHRRWMVEQQLPEPEQMRRRARRLADSLASSGHDREAIERQLASWRFHPAVAFRSATDATQHPVSQPGSSSWPAGVRPQ